MRGALFFALFVGCSNGPSVSSSQPRLLVDDQPFTAQVDAHADRQRAHVAVTSPAAPLLFGKALTALSVDLDLTTVPDDDPTQYDIALVAACSREEQLEVTLDSTRYVEAVADAQPSYHQLSIDGCALTPGVMQLTGQTNIQKLDQKHLVMEVIFQLTEGGEKHDVTVDRLDLAF